MVKSENFIMRGAVLRNTKWILGKTFTLGLVIYTGLDTKLMRNS
jgi:hypothetical protein